MKKSRTPIIVIVVMLVMIMLHFLMIRNRSTIETEFGQIAEENKLVVYTSHEPIVYEPIIKEFEERTGIWVEVVTGGTNELLEKIASQEGASYADIMFGGGGDSINVYADYFEPYQCKQKDDIYTMYQTQAKNWIPFSKFPIVFVYNKKLVYSAGTPRSWAELLENRWKGKIAFANPQKSGTSYTALATMIQVLGIEKKEQIIGKFIDNLDGFMSDGSAEVIEDVMSGTKMIGITSEEKALKSIENGIDLGMVYPTEGTSAVPDATAIIKGARHFENAKLFIEFTVSEDVQKYIEEKCYRRSVRIKNASNNLKHEILYDLKWASEEQDKVLDCWTRNMTGKDI